MNSALRLTPKSLGYKLSDDTDLPLPGAIDTLQAKLMIEAEEDEDVVRKAFIGVFNFSALYAIEKGEKAPSKQLDKTENLIRKNLEDMQTAMRARLK